MATEVLKALARRAGPIEAARRRENAAREIVVRWVEQEAKAGRLGFNDQAPGWSAYVAAVGETDRLLRAAGLE